jgi:hypothetical protein
VLQSTPRAHALPCHGNGTPRGGRPASASLVVTHARLVVREERLADELTRSAHVRLLERALDRIESASPGDVIGCTWQKEAIEHSHRAMIEEEHAARGAGGPGPSLTGCHVAASLVAVDRDAGIAILALDGVRFRLQRHEVVLLRPCANCGTGEFASDPLITKGDLGHALGVWRPLHHGCEAEDPTEW